MPQATSVAIAIFVGTGGRYEDFDSEYGVTHLLEHLVFKGTKHRSNPKKIPELIDSVGGYINAYTTEEMTCFYVKLPLSAWRLGVDVLADLVQYATLPPREIEREKNVVLEEMNVERDDPANFVFDLVGDLLWPTDKLRTNILGNEQTISSISRTKIKQYYKVHYNVSNMVVATAGNLELKEIIDEINEHIKSSKPKKNVKAKPTTGTIARQRSSLLSQETNQSHFVIAARGPSLDDADEMPLRVLSTILGSGFSSRLFLNVREARSLAYTVYSSVSSFTDSGSFEIYAGVNKQKFAQALRAVRHELARLRTQRVPDKELAKAKQLMRGRLLMSLEDSSYVADRLGSQIVLHGSIWSIEETLAKIDAVTSREVMRVAKRYLTPPKLRLAFIGPYTERDQKRFEKILAD